MKARPILMSSPMVRALIDNRKTQTRRIVKPKPNGAQLVVEDGKLWHDDGQLEEVPCRYGQPGDLLWVRETFIPGWNLDSVTDKPIDEDSLGKPIPIRAFYRATEPENFRWLGDDGYLTENIPWKPSIHMPRWASRLTLELTEVRVERLQDISKEDAKAEGCTVIEHSPLSVGYYSAYRDLWESINGPGSWDANPFCWCLSFSIHQKNIDALLAERGQA